VTLGTRSTDTERAFHARTFINATYNKLGLEERIHARAQQINSRPHAEHPAPFHVLRRNLGAEVIVAVAIRVTFRGLGTLHNQHHPHAWLGLPQHLTNLVCVDSSARLVGAEGSREVDERLTETDHTRGGIAGR